MQDIESYKNVHPNKIRKVFDNELLVRNSIQVGDIVTCFDDRGNMRGNFWKVDGSHTKIKSVTFGLRYKVLEINPGGLVWIRSDEGKFVWLSSRRFLFSLRVQRRLKLEKLKNKL